MYICNDRESAKQVVLLPRLVAWFVRRWMNFMKFSEGG